MFAKFSPALLLVLVLSATALGQARVSDPVPPVDPDSETVLGIYHELIVDNHAHQEVRIYYNDRYLGVVAAHGHRHFHVHDHGDHFDLRARGVYGKRWSRHVHGEYESYTWTLVP